MEKTRSSKTKLQIEAAFFPITLVPGHACVKISFMSFGPFVLAFLIYNMAYWSLRFTSWRISEGRIISRPTVMGIVNVTPDSFSDGGHSFSMDHAVAFALRLVEEGADILDIGGESSRPGALAVSVEEETRRVIPVVEAISKLVSIPVSVDTTKAEIARQAIQAGATIINDIRALEGDPEMLPLLAASDLGIVLMHMKGEPRTMQEAPEYVDVVQEVHDFLALRIERAEAAGIERSRIAIDPGIGFGKTIEHNLELLRHLDAFADLHCPLLIGTSRKRFLGTLTGRDVSERATASVVSALAALVSGADIVRVHDVGPMVDAVKVWEAQCGWGKVD